VLLSGGLDSAVLLMEEALRGEAQPVYVGVGLAWEKAERETIARFVEAAGLNGRVRPLVVLTVDMTDVYPKTHWAMQGRPPGYHTPDENVYLPGRNVILLGKTAVFCAASGIGRIVIGTLDHNPFPDATPAFRAAMQAALSLGLGHELSIDAPYARTSKANVIRRGIELGAPLALTLSCMQPATAGRGAPAGPTGEFVHCGQCSKCRERHLAFVEAGVADPTIYADQQFVRSDVSKS
jgi:7-cyano-7-deazaguanine synthase